MNRRAGFAQPVIDAFSLLVIVAIILIFFLLFSLANKERIYTLKEHVASVDGNTVLFSFLQMPIDYPQKTPSGPTVPQQKLTMAEVIARADYSRAAQSIAFIYNVKAPALRFMSDFHKTTGCPIRIIIKTPETTESIDPGLGPVKPCLTYNPYYHAIQTIPRSDGSVITVELFAGVKR
jgi:hypothetical protein